MEQEAGNIVQQFICRTPKKNHVWHSWRKSLSIYLEIMGGLRLEYSQLSNTEDMADFINILKTVPSNKDKEEEEEEVWMEQIFFRDSKHKDEYIAKCANDENMERLYKQFMNLITPGSAIMSEFSRIRV
jgi:hypothetical protein